jgi:hypothetical protein
MNKTLIIVSVFNIIACSFIAYWVPTTLVNSQSAKESLIPVERADSLAKLQSAIEQTRALIFQQASQWEQEVLLFNRNQENLNEILIDLAQRLENLEGSMRSNAFAGDQYAEKKKVRNKKITVDQLNSWKNGTGLTALNTFIHKSDKIATYITDSVDLSESETAEINEIIQMSLVETANVISSSPDFSDVDEFNQMLSDVQARKEDRIRQTLSPKQYQQYQQLGQTRTIRRPMR